MISTIFETIGEAVTSFVSVLGNGVQGVTSMFYNATDGNLTFMGTLLLIASGVGIVYWAFRLIRGLVARA